MEKNIDDMEFEEALAELEKISSAMSEGKLSLKKAAEMYEIGVKLKDHCSKILESIELKMNQISAGQNISGFDIRKEGMKL